ncbi:His/Glu/Gln/Arg/opine family amino acid ABC transporter permease subunit [Rhizobium cellulosilyticum]|uniref:His/Glu/Gln/Arg/opine family amino acid ABC transporter permease subunit n=1 Tax=Aliirhizobium cellulosilyticum TaxID=393664 RepID=A0A7W6WRP5_9HYPH|nr:His/Glu/Gln/Arg/opine family amino acid ABC transporter permease subunit [Rhizobium cellulosilyticum]MBB4413837.1 His/Glu/Gln/Arg/opine family amino acid ABC transporter permease subunit [Rhizobium cellulosilyticum]MBB4448452.1 His/Glu/Gln/Arg/opine family amino acid ABC transporter permease subunit [Rhizobium cellulosilyticum]
MTISTDFNDVTRASAETSKPANGDYSHYRIVPARYPARTVGTVFAVVLIAATVHSVLGNERWGWGVFAEWFFAEPVLVGLGRTLLLTALGASLGFLLGTGLALARVSGSPLLAGISWTYVWIFRSIPLIVLLLILNNLGYLYETITIGVPYTGINFISWNTTQLITPFAAAVLGLALHAAAFTSEIVRGGILSVDQGQHEAAAALSLPRHRQFTRIVLPQAMRSILPNGFNEIILLAKGSSQVYILALPELFYTIQIIYRRNLEVIPLLMVATVWYLVILTVLSIVQHQIERHYSRGALRKARGCTGPASRIAEFSGTRSLEARFQGRKRHLLLRSGGSRKSGTQAQGSGISQRVGAFRPRLFLGWFPEPRAACQSV